MRKNIVIICFSLLAIAVCTFAFLSRNRKVAVVPAGKKVVTMEDFYEQEIEMRHCRVSAEEAEKAYVFWVNHDETMKKMIDENKVKYTALAKALRAVLEKQEDPVRAYQENKLHDFAIHEEDWAIFVKSIKTVKEIEDIEARIPDNEKKYLDEQSREQFRTLLESWLLREYILCVFDRMYPDKRNMGKEEKIEMLKYMGIQSMGLPLSQTAVWESVMMKVYPKYDFSEFFADRLKFFPEYAVQCNSRSPKGSF